MARLDMIEGFYCGTQVLLPDDAVIGRNPQSFLYLPEPHVSRHHARILRRGTTFVIEDLQSSNGVLVHGKRLVPHVPTALQDGDEIRIGSTRMVFRADLPLPPLQGARAAADGPTEQMPQRLALASKEGMLWVRVRTDDAAPPAVAMALDASANMMEVSEAEKHTDKGLREALKRLQAICQVSTALSAITDREILLDTILNCLFDLFPAVERAFVMLRDPERRTLVPVVSRRRDGSVERQEDVAISRTIVQEVVLHRRSILSFDALDDTRFTGNTSIIDLSIRSMMCAPLLAGDEILGLIQVDTCTTPRGFTAEDLQMLTGISAQAAIALHARAAERAQEELRQAKAAAEQANRAKSTFLANVSHELRTPLNAILGYSEMLIEDAADLEHPTMLADLQKIHRAGKHLLTLINDILDLSKIEAGKTGLHLETFDVPYLLEEVRCIVQPAASHNATTLDITVADGVSLMHADLIKVRQCLLNLLSNACKFTTQGRITLHVTRERAEGRDWLLFRVQDTGIGIPAEQIGTLFQEFMQVDASTTRKYGGTGLGLAISRHFCQMMGGDISAVSTVGQGSTFTMRLPVEVSACGSNDDTIDEDVRPHTATLIAGSCLPPGRG